MARSSRRIYKEGKIILWINLCSPESIHSCYISYGQEMLEFHRLVLLVAHEDDPVLGYTSLQCSLHRDLEEWPLRYQCFGTRVFQLKCQLLRCIARIRGRHYPSGPVHAPDYGRCVDAIRCEEGQDIPFSPFP